jgi:hypothetical protein
MADLYNACLFVTLGEAVISLRTDYMHCDVCQQGRLGGVVVSVLASGPKGCGFEPGLWDGFLKAIKNPRYTFLSDGK